MVGTCFSKKTDEFPCQYQPCGGPGADVSLQMAIKGSSSAIHINAWCFFRKVRFICAQCDQA
ncbi:hypothetical protein ABMA08_17135 [Pseudomonas yamanorum]